MNDLMRKAKQYLENREEMKKLLKKENFILLFLVGILLMVLKIPSGAQKNKSEETYKTQAVQTTDEQVGFSIEDYEKYLEKKTQEMLSCIETVGKVSVMITFRNEGKQVVEKDFESQSNSETTYDSAGGNQESSHSSVSQSTKYYTNESGKEIPFVNENCLPMVEGVLIVAEGGDDAKVNLQISQACQALFGIEAHKIVIVKGNTLERRSE